MCASLQKPVVEQDNASTKVERNPRIALNEELYYSELQYTCTIPYLSANIQIFLPVEESFQESIQLDLRLEGSD
jgi:hypothetical protein